MKKACVVGGSNGIGLAITLELLHNGYHVYVVDISNPDYTVLNDTKNYTYIKCNLLDFYTETFRDIANDKELELLMITAGFGRVAHFESLSLGEVTNILSVNAVSTIKIIKIFYDKIKSHEKFYCGIMGSIAGFINSPLFSVYGASKAAICRFVESVKNEHYKRNRVD